MVIYIGFTHRKWWFSIVFCMFTRPGMSCWNKQMKRSTDFQYHPWKSGTALKKTCPDCWKDALKPSAIRKSWGTTSQNPDPWKISGKNLWVPQPTLVQLGPIYRRFFWKIHGPISPVSNCTRPTVLRWGTHWGMWFFFSSSSMSFRGKV